MQYKALLSFSGVVSMAMGEIKEIKDESIANDLLNVGYIEEVKEAKVKKTEKVKETKTKRGGKKKNED